MADHDEVVARFTELTQSTPETARGVLQASNWSLEDALNLHYTAGETGHAQPMVEDEAEDFEDMRDVDDDDDDNFEPPSTLPSTSQPTSQSLGPGRTLGGGGGEAATSTGASTSETKASSAAGKAKRTGGLMTLGDLKGSSGSGPARTGDDSDDDEHQDMFAGGEKSGLAIENPGKNSKNDKDSLVKKILKKAEAGTKARQENPPEEEESGPSKPRFSGTGQTLGSDDVPSQAVPDPSAATAKKPEKAIRKLYFWKDGFSIEDGPLMRYDDPQHRASLEAIQAGRAPLHLMNVAPGQPTDVHVFRKMDEEYKPPPKKIVPFAGSGQRLGAPTPGEINTGSSTSSQVAVATPSVPAAEPRTVDLNPDEPSTNIQIRLGDGSRLVSKFNHTHTVQDLYAFVNASNTQSRTRSYVLQTTFPTKELNEMEKTLKEAGLINAVVVQKWN